MCLLREQSSLIRRCFSDILIFPQTVYCWGSQCCLKCVRLGWGAVSALSPNLSPIWLCLSPLPICLPICLPSGFVFHLGWGAVSASLGLSPNLSHLALSFILAGLLCPPHWACLPICLPSALSFSLAGVLCPPRWACLPICLPSGFVFHLGWVYVGWGVVPASLGLSPNLSPNLSPTWLCLSPWLGGCVRLAGLVS